MYPKVKIYIKNIIENSKKMQKICKDNNIHLSVVTKLISDSPPIIKHLVDSGIDCICESRMENIKSYSNIGAEKWFIREPMFSEIEDVIDYIDVSLNSEIETIVRLNDCAKKKNKIHKVILMYELGDLREGCERQELFETIEKCLKLDNIKLHGIGTNLSCYGGIIPTEENMNEFAFLAEEIEEKFNITLKIVSGGNSSSFKLLTEKKLPAKINNFRFGESIYLGNVPCFDEPITEFNKNNFVLEAQIVELKEKNSVPRGISYVDAFGNKPHFEDKGRRMRAIIAVGKQDISISGLTPVDEKIEILGCSSDYVILDVTDSERQYKLGDIISFNMDYAATLRVMTSEYVHKELVE